MHILLHSFPIGVRYMVYRVYIYIYIYPPNQGSGQGNGAGPTIWVMISSILLTIMRDNSYGLDAL